MKVAVFPKPWHNEVGLDAVILEPDATAADLLAAMEPFSDDEEITKPYLPARRGVCRGCPDNCCVRSWIAPDLPAVSALLKSRGLTWTELADRYLDRAAYARGVVRFRSRPCIFLVDNCCQVYEDRPAICRFFVCSPLTAELEDLGHRIIGVGLAALIQTFSRSGLLPEKPDLLPIIEWHNKSTDLYEQEFLRFYLDSLGRQAPERFSYAQVLLKDLCNPGQWQTLTRSCFE